MMLSLFTNDVRRNPFPLYERLRSETPTTRDPHTGAWIVLDYDGVKRVLNDSDAFSSAASPPGTITADWLIFADPPRHTKLRALVMRAFTPRAVAGLQWRIHEIASDLLDGLRERDEIDLVSEFSVPLPLRVIAEMLGAPSADIGRFRRWTDAIVSLSHTVSGDPRAGKAVADVRIVNAEMREYLPTLLEARRISPTEDLLTRLVHAEIDGDRLTDDEILGFFQLLLLAGHETTTNLIDNAIIALCEHPDQLALLRAAPDLLTPAIEEVLRFRSPVQTMFRVARAPVTLGTSVIPAGSLVLAMIGSANRDPGRFAEPNRFDVTRTPNPHVAFGHGIHFCVGAPLARLEAHTALELLLERWTTFALASDDPWEPREAFHVHGPSALRVKFERR